ncbi:MAG: hypothetical protein AB8F94_17400 [Saprospiraceae bacterium]
MKKKFELGVGKYYFNIRNGQQNITLSRAEKSDAVYTYLNYVQLGKDCEWLGKWEGKKFSDNTAPSNKMA